MFKITENPAVRLTGVEPRQPMRKKQRREKSLKLLSRLLEESK